jgi:hypothetical protein
MEQDIRKNVEEALTKPKFLYNNDFVNQTGAIKDGDKKNSEVAAAVILENIEKLENIRTIERKHASYKTDSHDEIAGRENSPIDISKDSENIIAKKMYKKRFSYIGEIIDFEVPLNDKQGDKVGKMDLLSYDGSDAYLLELKWINTVRRSGRETLLRAVLEAYTYWITADRDKLLSDFKQQLPQGINLRKAVLAFRDSQQHRDFLAADSKNVRELMRRLKVDLFIYAEKDDSVDVIESHKWETID